MKPDKIVEHETYKGMYYLEWPDGVQSADFYNLTRAKDILKNYDSYVNNMEMGGNTRARRPLQCTEKPVGAFK